MSNCGFKDVCLALKGVALPLFLAKSDIRQRYRRSTLGPFWITISTGIMIACIGVIFGNIFKSSNSDFLPFLASGLIIWGFISTVITEATSVFVNAESIVKQLPIPLFTHVLRMVDRNFIIFLHNIVIFPLVCLVVWRPITLEILWLVPGVAVLILNLLWISLLLGMVCTRFRDMAQIVQSLLQVAFYVTPIIWMPSLLASRAGSMILAPNPFYHLIDIVRLPLMGQMPTVLNWLYVLGLAFFGWAVTIYFYNNYRHKIAYWL